jgi:hypothetical protein
MPPRKKVVEEAKEEKGLNTRYIVTEVNKRLEAIEADMALLKENTKELYAMLVNTAKAASADISELKERVAPLEAKKAQYQSIQKTEAHNFETAPEPREESNMRMNHEYRIQSMRNVIAVLPPNHIVDGRQPKQNVQAICGFLVSDEMMDEAYAKLEGRE